MGKVYEEVEEGKGKMGTWGVDDEEMKQNNAFIKSRINDKKQKFQTIKSNLLN
jgi:hypothetical protein